MVKVQLGCSNYTVLEMPAHGTTTGIVAVVKQSLAQARRQAACAAEDGAGEVT